MPRFTDRLRELGITRPTLLLDKSRVMRNIEKMKQKADQSGVRFRPHFKTHQSAEIGTWFQNIGVQSITVSSIDMAEYFASHGWEDITVAFTANLHEMNRINSLAGKIKLQLLADANEPVRRLDAAVQHEVQVWIEVDVGYPRTGISWDDFDQIRSLAQCVLQTSRLKFAGLLTHSGHSHQAKTIDDIKAVHQDSLFKLQAVKEKLTGIGLSSCALSIGDTPTCSVVESLRGVDEIRPGTFVFFDMTQSRLGSCKEEDIAVAVACPLVGKYPLRNQVVIYGGAVHLSKDFLLDEQGRKVYGYVAQDREDSWGTAVKGAAVVSLSQEHGIIDTPESLFRKIQIGDFLVILPVHTCLTSDLFRFYLTTGGEKISRRQSNDQL